MSFKLYRFARQIKESLIEQRDTWRGIHASGLLGRFVVICFGVWLHAADSLVTATIAPAIVEDIGGVAYINWTLMLYQVGAIAAAAAATAACARLGLKRLMIVAVLLYGAACLVAGLAPAMGALLAGRLAQGIGGGVLLSLCNLAIQQWFPPGAWSRLFGVVAVIWGAGSLLGPLVGGLFAGLHAWRWAFFTFAAQAALLGILAALWLPPDPARPARARSWSFTPLLVLCAATLLIAESSVAARLGLSVAECLVGSALLYGAARLDRRSPSRLFPLQALDVRHPVGAGLLMVFALSVSTNGFWAYGPLIMKVLFDIPPLTSGYILAIEAVAWSLATLAVSTAPISADRRLIRGGVTLIALGAAGFTVAVPAGTLFGIMLCALLQGAGFGLCWPSVVHRLTRYADEDERPLAVTAPETMQHIGYAVGAAAVGIAANLSGLAEGISIAALRSVAFWVFAAFIPVLAAALVFAWRFTAADSP